MPTNVPQNLSCSKQYSSEVTLSPPFVSSCGGCRARQPSCIRRRLFSGVAYIGRVGAASSERPRGGGEARRWRRRRLASAPSKPSFFLVDPQSSLVHRLDKRLSIFWCGHPMSTIKPSINEVHAFVGFCLQAMASTTKEENHIHRFFVWIR